VFSSIFQSDISEQGKVFGSLARHFEKFLCDNSRFFFAPRLYFVKRPFQLIMILIFRYLDFWSFDQGMNFRLAGFRKHTPAHPAEPSAFPILRSYAHNEHPNLIWTGDEVPGTLSPLGFNALS
jgi:hypothetical protein